MESGSKLNSMNVSFKVLERQVAYTISKSFFYKRKFGNVNLSDINNFHSLPFTSKSELLIDQQEYPPFGSNICVQIREIQRIHKTSGTTNTPLIIALTRNDIENTIKIGSKCFKSAGLKKNDTVIHCLNYNMWAGGYTDHQSLEATGAAVIPFGIGNSHNLIETILLLKPTAIHCTPSYLKKLELIIRDDFKLQPHNLGLRLGLFGAESGLQNPTFRASIEDKWGLIAMNANYGLSDVLSMFGSECEYQKGLHFFGKEIIYPELIDPETLVKRTIQDGEIGELVLTNLAKESQPLLRYRTNDVIKILSTKKCNCGYEGFTFEVVGRTDDMIVIKGVNVFINAIEYIVSGFEELNSGMINIHVNKVDPIDKIKIDIEVKNNQNKRIDLEFLKKSLISKMHNKLNFTPDINILSEGELKRTEGKTKKLFRTL